EIDNTDLVFIFGYNPADSHPIVALYLNSAKHNPAPIKQSDQRKKQNPPNYQIHNAQKNTSNNHLLNKMVHLIK
ncbi:formate dehydrogenase subunit alpha, partial [Enterobacter intestinihominis]